MIEKIEMRTYGALECPAKIISVECVQEPGFDFSGRYCDEIARSGYKPTDAVYSVKVEFGEEAGKSKGQFSGQFLSIEELYALGKAYNADKPEDLIGKEVICRYAYHPTESFRNLGAIVRIDPKIS